jgi:hypothetical protein
MVDDIISRDDPWPTVGIVAEGFRKILAGTR